MHDPKTGYGTQNVSRHAGGDSVLDTRMLAHWLHLRNPGGDIDRWEKVVTFPAEPPMARRSPAPGTNIDHRDTEAPGAATPSSGHPENK